MTLEVLSGGPDKRRRRTRDEVEQLNTQIIEVLTEDHPQSVRHVFYRMTDPRLSEPVEKSDRGYDQVQHRLKELRLSGDIPYGWITDTTRRGYHVITYNSGVEFLRDMAGLYRADLWQSSDYYCEVWVESRSLAGVVLKDCQELAVSLYPAGGFTSMTLPYEAARQIRAEIDDTDKQPVIIYIGDYDPAGVMIDRDIKAKLHEHLPALVEIDFRRIAINEDQIVAYDLPTKPRKESERRARHIKSTVEAESMPAHIMRDLLRREVESLLPAGALAVAKAAEESERQGLIEMARIRGAA